PREQTRHGVGSAHLPLADRPARLLHPLLEEQAPVLVARKGRRAPRQPQPLPPPLPPERRSIGQLVAETIRFYQHHFWQTLPLGLSVAALTQLTVAFGHKHREPRGHPPPQYFHKPTSILGGGVEVTILLGSLLLTASYIVAIVLVTGKRPERRALAT